MLSRLWQTVKVSDGASPMSTTLMILDSSSACVTSIKDTGKAVDHYWLVSTSVRHDLSWVSIMLVMHASQVLLIPSKCIQILNLSDTELI